MEKKIDIIIITGFLGAGKTTLLNQLISSCSDLNIGLLVNDFGKIPVDGSLIRNSVEGVSNSKIYEIGNGSIFCSCLTSSFIFGLRYFMQKSPDLLFIETSGMSDPSSMARLLSENALLGAYRIKHVLCVIDSTNVLKLRKNFNFVDRQINSSNTILLNKSDLIGEEEITGLTETVREINDGARIVKTSYCEFDFASLPYESFRPEGDAQSCNTKENAPRTMFLPQYDFPETHFTNFLNSLVDKTMRIKGYYKFQQKPSYFSNNNGLVERAEVSVETVDESGITLIYEGQFHDSIEQDWRQFKERFHS